MKSCEKSISLVRGGQAQYAAALAWQKKGAFPGQTAFSDWLSSTKENPVVVKFEVRYRKPNVSNEEGEKVA